MSPPVLTSVRSPIPDAWEGVNVRDGSWLAMAVPCVLAAALTWFVFRRRAVRVTDAVGATDPARRLHTGRVHYGLLWTPDDGFDTSGVRAYWRARGYEVYDLYLVQWNREVCTNSLTRTLEYTYRVRPVAAGAP